MNVTTGEKQVKFEKFGGFLTDKGVDRVAQWSICYANMAKQKLA
jgi:hypothetical protein